MSKTKENKTPNVSVNQSDKIVQCQKQDTFTIDFQTIDENVEIIVKPRLSLSETMAFCKSVVDGVFGDTYRPFWKESTIRNYILAYYTNITLPKDLEKVYELCFETDIIDTILNHDCFDKRQFDNMLIAIDEMIDFKKQEVLHQSPIADLIENINGVISKLGGTFEGLDIKDVVSKLGEVGRFDEEKIVQALIKTKTDEVVEKETNIEIVK